MPATEINIADAVVTELNDSARSWAGQFVATREWLPVYIRTETSDPLSALKVAVMTLGNEQARLTRAKDQFKFDVHVDFQKRVDNRNTTEMDALSLLAEQVHDYFRRNSSGGERELAALAGWFVESAERPLVY